MYSFRLVANVVFSEDPHHTNFVIHATKQKIVISKNRRILFAPKKYFKASYLSEELIKCWKNSSLAFLAPLSAILFLETLVASLSLVTFLFSYVRSERYCYTWGRQDGRQVHRVCWTHGKSSERSWNWLKISSRSRSSCIWNQGVCLHRYSFNAVLMTRERQDHFLADDMVFLSTNTRSSFLIHDCIRYCPVVNWVYLAQVVLRVAFLYIFFIPFLHRSNCFYSFFSILCLSYVIFNLYIDNKLCILFYINFFFLSHHYFTTFKCFILS